MSKITGGTFVSRVMFGYDINNQKECVRAYAGVTALQWVALRKNLHPLLLTTKNKKAKRANKAAKSQGAGGPHFPQYAKAAVAYAAHCFAAKATTQRPPAERSDKRHKGGPAAAATAVGEHYLASLAGLQPEE